MTLGERIYKLRTAKDMSQVDLADALGVSRQSISKWETNGSVPELDKLIKLSEIFGVSLDELVLDKKTREAEPVAEPEPKGICVERHSPRSTHKTLGVVLLCFAALVWLLVSLIGDVFAGLVMASPFVACGLICLLARRNVGLWCLWVVYAFLDIYFRFATGIHWGFVFQVFAYRSGMTVQLIMAWIWLLCFGGLTVTTVLRFRKPNGTTIRKNAFFAAGFWISWVLIWVALAAPMRGPEIDVEAIQTIRLFSSAFGILREGVLVAALVFTIRVIGELSAKRKKQ